MIKQFVNKFYQNREKLLQRFSYKHPKNYAEIVKAVIEVVTDEEGWRGPDPNNIHEINDGDCRGTLLYVIPEKCYQPVEYWTVKVTYGSCSGCDTLMGIQEYAPEKPTPESVDDYMTLALHIVQSLKEI